MNHDDPSLTPAVAPKNRTAEELRITLGLIPWSEREAQARAAHEEDIAKNGYPRSICDMIAGRNTGKTTRMLVCALSALDHGKRVEVVGRSKQQSDELTRQLEMMAKQVGVDPLLIVRPMTMAASIGQHPRFYDHTACG